MLPRMRTSLHQGIRSAIDERVRKSLSREFALGTIHQIRVFGLQKAGFQMLLGVCPGALGSAAAAGVRKPGSDKNWRRRICRIRIFGLIRMVGNQPRAMMRRRGV